MFSIPEIKRTCISSDNPPDAQPQKTDTLIFFLILCTSFILFLFLKQANLEFNGAAFLAAITDRVIFHSHHALYLPILYFFTKAASFFGMSRMTSGIFLSAISAAAALACFYLLLRKFVSSKALCLLFVLLLFCNYPVLFSATTVETYSTYLLFSVLSLLFAHKTSSDYGNIRNWVALTLIFIVMISFHVAGAFLVFSICVGEILFSLVKKNSTHKRLAVRWLVSGAISALFLVATLAQRGVFTGITHELVWSEQFFSCAFDLDGILSALGKSTKEFFIPALFTAWLFPVGLLFLRESEKHLIAIALMVHLTFLGFFGFWVPDHGSFYLPLYPLDALLSAILVERFLRDDFRAKSNAPHAATPPSVILLSFIGLAIAYYAILAFVNAGTGYWWAIWAFLAILTLATRQLLKNPPSAFDRATQTSQKTVMRQNRTLVVGFCILLAAGNFYSSFPQALNWKEISETRRLVSAAQKVLPTGGYLVANIQSQYVDAYSRNLRGVYTAAILYPGGTRRVGKDVFFTLVFNRFLSRDTEILFDQFAYQHREEILGHLDVGEKIIRKIRFVPIGMNGFTFWQVKMIS
jgi:hypothetical protein